MKLCFPADNFNGLKSKISEHFGTAPFFITYDTDTKEAGLVYASDVAGDDKCSPSDKLAEMGIDIVITGGIGSGALNRLLDAGLHVMQAKAGIVDDDIQHYLDGGLSLLGYGSGECSCG